MHGMTLFADQPLEEKIAAYLRRVQGAVLGALVIGVATALNAQYGFTIWTSAEIYGLLIVILLIRPTGLLGNRAW